MEVVLLSQSSLIKDDFLNKSDKDSIRKISFKKKKESSLGKFGLKKAYKAFTQSSENLKEIEILKNKEGMPFIKNNPNISCSISHSCNHAIAIVDNRTVGIDIEKIRNHKKELVDYILSPEEFRYAAENDINLTITKTWVIKEAVLKAVGMGFKLDPKRVKIYKKVKNNYLVIINNKDGLPNKKFNVLAFQWESFYIAIAMEAQKNGKYKINWNNFTSIQLPKVKAFSK